jgi:cysteine desulfurase
MHVYLDNGSTTKVDPKVLKAMIPYFSEKFGNASSPHRHGREARKALQRSRSTIAEKINADPSEIIFTSGGTESDNLAIRGVADANKHLGKHIITTKIEHPAVLNTCNSLIGEGFNVTFLDVDKEGFVDLKALEKTIKKETILVSIIHGNNEIGTIQDVKKIGEICKRKRTLFHIDAVQSFAKVPIDVKKMNIDLLSVSSHKIHGPKGVGALYVRKGTKIKPQSTGGSHEFKKRAGTENIHGVVGLAKAVEFMGKEDVNRMKSLRDRLISGLLSVPDSRLNGPKGNKRLSNNVNVSFKRIEGESLLTYLDTKGICVSTGSACASEKEGPSHVLKAINVDDECIMGSVRLTLSKFTTREEIDYTVKSVKQIVKHLRRISAVR